MAEKKTYVNLDKNTELFNKAQAYLTGNDYVYGQAYDSDFWSSQGGGGKNQLYGNTGSKTYAGKQMTTTDLETIKKYVAEQDKKAEEAKFASVLTPITQDLNATKTALEEARNEYQALGGMVNAYMTMANQQQAQSQQANEQAKQANAQSINQNYNNSARDYYRMYKQNQVLLPEQLSKVGVTGGASESASLALLNNYGNNLVNNELARNNALYSNDANYNDRIADNSINMAKQMANNYLAMAQLQYQEEKERQQKQEDKALQAQALAKQQEVDAWNNNVQANIAKRIREGYEVYDWTDSEGKLHYRLLGNGSTPSPTPSPTPTPTPSKGDTEKVKNILADTISKMPPGYDALKILRMVDSLVATHNLTEAERQYLYDQFGIKGE